MEPTRLGTAGEDAFRREGEYWTIVSDGRLFRLRDSKGLGQIARLLERPLAKVHVTVLAGENGGADGATVERRRVSVTKTIRGAVARIARHDPALGLHLARSIRTGAFCCYAPIAAPGERPRVIRVLG